VPELCLTIDPSDGCTPEPSVCPHRDRSNMEILFLRIDLGGEMCRCGGYENRLQKISQKILSDAAAGGHDAANKLKTTYGSVAHTLIRMRC
jgi:hypothetical protein